MRSMLALVLVVLLAGCARDDGWNDMIFGKLSNHAPLAGGAHDNARR